MSYNKGQIIGSERNTTDDFTTTYRHTQFNNTAFRNFSFLRFSWCKTNHEKFRKTAVCIGGCFFFYWGINLFTGTAFANQLLPCFGTPSAHFIFCFVLPLFTFYPVVFLFFPPICAVSSATGSDFLHLRLLRIRSGTIAHELL